MLFNFSYHKCALCGILCDDGGFFCDEWLCLDCLDDLSE